MINPLAGLGTVRPGRTRSISAENPTGAAGGGGRAELGSHSTAYASRDLPVGWKKSPCIDLAGNEVRTIAEIEGPGTIQHLWFTTLPKFWRQLVLRFFWDDADLPAIAVPLGDFFCMGWEEYAPLSSLPITVAPAGGLNSYWEMPFHSAARITVENLAPDPVEGFFYQITWEDGPVAAEAAHLHAQWRRSDPLEYQQPHEILAVPEGAGHYVGTYLAWETHHPGWWGEGEVKFHLDGDEEFPSICGTGTEDYFGGAWAFEHPTGHYSTYDSAFLGMPQVIEPSGFYANQQRFGLYRWHIPDPVRFTTDLRVSVQALGFRRPTEGLERYRPLRDDIASTAFWYQAPGGGPPEPGTPLTLDHLDPS